MNAAAVLAVAAVFWSGLALTQEAAPGRWKGWCDLSYPLEKGPPPRLNLPAWACEAAYDARLHIRYTPYTKINPFFLTGDFNGDGRTDAAVWVTNKKTRQRGIIVLHQGDKQPNVIGAGVNLGDRGDDYSGLDMWSLIPKGEVLNSNWENHRKLVLQADALWVGRSESASVAIYWDGRTYSFYQLTD